MPRGHRLAVVFITVSLESKCWWTHEFFGEHLLFSGKPGLSAALLRLLELSPSWPVFTSLTFFVWKNPDSSAWCTSSPGSWYHPSSFINLIPCPLTCPPCIRVPDESTPPFPLNLHQLDYSFTLTTSPTKLEAPPNTSPFPLNPTWTGLFFYSDHLTREFTGSF